MTAKVKYNRELLEQVCERDKCVIDFDKIEKYNRDVRIEFACSCGNVYIKNYYQIYNCSRAYCKTCTQINQQKKSKQTFIQKYGVDNPLKNEVVKNKTKTTMLLKYGVEHPSQLDEFKRKKKLPA